MRDTEREKEKVVAFLWPPHREISSKRWKRLAQVEASRTEAERDGGWPPSMVSGYQRSGKLIARYLLPESGTFVCAFRCR